jgi:hypothetical protein
MPLAVDKPKYIDLRYQVVPVQYCMKERTAFSDPSTISTGVVFQSYIDQENKYLHRPRTANTVLVSVTR